MSLAVNVMLSLLCVMSQHPALYTLSLRIVYFWGLELLEFVLYSLYVDLQYYEIIFVVTAWSVCVLVLYSPLFFNAFVMCGACSVCVFVVNPIKCKKNHAHNITITVL